MKPWSRHYLSSLTLFCLCLLCSLYTEGAYADDQNNSTKTVGDVKQCVSNVHKNCSLQCAEKIPEIRRDHDRHCCDAEFEHIRESIEICLMVNSIPDELPCFKAPEVPKGPLKKKKLTGFLASIMEFKECEEDCMRTAQDECYLGCAEMSDDIFWTLKSCLRLIDYKAASNGFLKCISELQYNEPQAPLLDPIGPQPPKPDQRIGAQPPESKSSDLADQAKQPILLAPPAVTKKHHSEL